MNLVCSVGSCEKQRKMLLNQRLRHSSENACVCCGVQLVCMCLRVLMCTCMWSMGACAMCALCDMVVVVVTPC